MTVKRLTRALQRRFASYVRNPMLSLFCDSRWKIPGLGVERIGSAYGGGWVVLDWLKSSSLVLSFGIGEDITFDAMLIERTGCRVVGFDPTPRSASWVRSNPKLPARFTFMQVGLAEKSGTRLLFLQRNTKFVSGSITRDLQGGSVECAFMALDDILGSLGVSSVELMKMDIEGAEYLVFRDWLQRGYTPPARQIWVEFHPGLGGSTSRETAAFVRSLERLGFVSAKRAYLQNPDHYLLVAEHR